MFGRLTRILAYSDTRIHMTLRRTDRLRLRLRLPLFYLHLRLLSSTATFIVNEMLP